MPVALVVLAAGKGSRMKSDLPKVLHPIAGAPLVIHALKAGAAVTPERTVVVVGHGADRVQDVVTAHDPGVCTALQADQKGTGHAVAQAAPALDGFQGDVIVLYGDTPFISGDTLQAMIAARATHDVVVLGFEAADPGRYGRLIAHGDQLDRIVEFKDATPDERAVTLCNSGVMCAKSDVMFDLIAQIDDNNASGELYLTDIVELARRADMSAGVVVCDETETLGINTPLELSTAEAQFQASARITAQAGGVYFQAIDTVFMAHDTQLHPGAQIDPYVVFGPGAVVECGAHIRAFSHIEGTHVGAGAIVGPYARLRPGTKLGAGTRIGNFVETKNAAISDGAKVNHLSYIGDAAVGTDTNIGAGTITCNYDGVLKHKTTIGSDVFIGSNTMLVAPVTIGDQAMTGSGSVITEDVAAQALALGRAKQVSKPGFATRLKAMLLAKKKEQKG
ncbi:MAG: bifunctional UDP-N-acetylglucosamine diphosphorylase/glucosamine-1-phosphate N-acetyltransferase GlmU [Pseudomonadota bacterium]